MAIQPGVAGTGRPDVADTAGRDGQTALLLALPRLSADLGATNVQQLWISDSYGLRWRAWSSRWVRSAT